MASALHKQPAVCVHTVAATNAMPGSSAASPTPPNCNNNASAEVILTLGPAEKYSSPLPARAALYCHMLRGRPSDDRQYLQCKWPMPIFLIAISTLQVLVFIYDLLYSASAPLEYTSEVTVGGTKNIHSNWHTLDGAAAQSTLAQSLLVYRPDRRLELWRFVSYMLLHANWFHLAFNVLMQLLYGMPLELMHGSLRVAVIYFAGVLAGSLGISVIDPTVYLIGASSGVYALITAQLANLLLNLHAMRHGLWQLLSVVIFVCCDIGYLLYLRASNSAIQLIPAVSYIAHLTGSLAGFTMGLLVLQQPANMAYYSNSVWWLALSIYLAFTIYAILFNLLNTITAQLLEEHGQLIKRHWLGN